MFSRIVLGFLFSIALQAYSQEGASPANLSQDGPITIEKDPATLRQERISRNKEELRQIQLVDSVGWIKITAIKRVDENADDLEKERVQRKKRLLIGLCDESRFLTLVEVDSLSGLTADEKSFCKNRLKNANPIIE